MKLLACVNHAAPFHTGGSEKVIQQVTESMSRDFGADCTVLTVFANKTIVHNGVTVAPIAAKPQNFIDQVNGLKPDHVFVYSDFFRHWPIMLNNPKAIKAPKSIALVGMNYMRARTEELAKFEKNAKHFKVITHSNDYKDYQVCKSISITPRVIHNAIDFNEFTDRKSSFRQKYGIPTDKKLILCVSNFFPGKGQEHLHHILNQMGKKRDDFFALFISSRVNHNIAETLYKRHTLMLRRASYPAMSLRDLQREEVVQSFFESDVFAFPSQTEVAPLVALECMAAKLPYVSLNVGNVRSLAGGVICESQKIERGMLKYDNRVYADFERALHDLLDDDSLRYRLGGEGNQLIVDQYNWEKVKFEYKDVFTS